MQDVAAPAALEKSAPVPINMRADVQKRNLIDIGAKLAGRDRTSFILDAACQKAEELILDQKLFNLDDAAFEAFEQALENNPARGNKCLQQLLGRPKRWS